MRRIQLYVEDELWSVLRLKARKIGRRFRSQGGIAASNVGSSENRGCNKKPPGVTRAVLLPSGCALV